jgi:hypothetical protein
MPNRRVPPSPRCSVHVSRPMEYIGEASTLSWAGKKKVLGHRYRCAVEKCPCVETTLIPEPEPPPVKSPQMPRAMKKRLNQYPVLTAGR